MRHLWNFIFIFFAVFIVSVHCQSVSHVRKLYADLFSNYTKEVMSVYDHSKPLRVGVTFYLNSINSLKWVDETISIAGSFNLNWTDPFLTWNPSLYGNVHWPVFDSSDMWVPFIVLTNIVNKMATLYLMHLSFPTERLCTLQGMFSKPNVLQIFQNILLKNNSVYLRSWHGQCPNISYVSRLLKIKQY